MVSTSPHHTSPTQNPNNPNLSDKRENPLTQPPQPPTQPNNPPQPQPIKTSLIGSIHKIKNDPTSVVLIKFYYFFHTILVQEKILVLL